MRVNVDQQRCIGSGQCVVTEPAVFDQDEHEGFVTLLIEQPADRLRETVLNASRTCPVQAITVVDG
jgi:ferredoxin